MPAIRIHDNYNGRCFISTIDDRYMQRILKFIDSASNSGDFDVFIDEKWKGSFDEDEFSDFKSIFHLHYRIEEDQSSSYDY